MVRVKDKGSLNRVAWEHLTSYRRDSVTGWEVVCRDQGDITLATVPVEQLVYFDDTGCGAYGVRARYSAANSGIAYTESPE